MSEETKPPITSDVVTEQDKGRCALAPGSASRLAATQTELAAAFTEWERRYREEPDRFMSEASKLLKETPKSYGDACAPYLMQIIDELRP
jgi:hypothetical protein